MSYKLCLAFVVTFGSSAVGCSADKAAAPTHVFAPNPFAELPVNEDGKKVVIDAPSGGYQVQIQVDETLADPVTAKAACLDLVIGCIEKDGASGEASVTRCVAQAPTCNDDRPWEGDRQCCPAACKGAFAEASGGGVRAAFLAHIADGRQCYPALAGFLEGGVP